MILTHMDFTTLERLYRVYDYGTGRLSVDPREIEGDLWLCHVPKTGGTSMRYFIKGAPKSRYRDPMCGHRVLKSHMRSFAIIRNPFDWLVSAWHYNWPNKRYGVRNTWPCIERFLYEFNSFELSTEPVWNSINMFKHPVFSFRHLQACQTFDVLDRQGEKLSNAEFYGRFEMFSEVCALLGFKHMRRYNHHPHKDYRKFYNTKLIDHVSAHREGELNLLGYNFEGPTDTLPTFKIIKHFLWKPPED